MKRTVHYNEAANKIQHDIKLLKINEHETVIMTSIVKRLMSNNILQLNRIKQMKLHIKL